MADLREGRAAALYYYNLGCNIPIYLHIDLRKDNPHCVVLWWYASTCRHLGIGGTAKDPAVVAAQKAAMKHYRAAEDLYKQGEFFGLSEEIHVHAHGNRVAVNVFNLDDRARTIEGSIRLAEIELDPGRAYVFDEPWVRCSDGKLVVKAAFGPWGAKMAWADSGNSTKS